MNTERDFLIGYTSESDSDIYHHGIIGQKWGVRRYQNKDGSLTEEGKRRLYKEGTTSLNLKGRRYFKRQKKMLRQEASKKYDELLNDKLKKAGYDKEKMDSLRDALLKNGDDVEMAKAWKEITKHPEYFDDEELVSMAKDWHDNPKNKNRVKQVENLIEDYSRYEKILNRYEKDANDKADEYMKNKYGEDVYKIMYPLSAMLNNLNK